MSMVKDKHCKNTKSYQVYKLTNLQNKLINLQKLLHLV